MQIQQDVITPQQAGTLHGLFVERVRSTPDKIAYRHFIDGVWRDYTWREMRDEVGRWQVALGRLGLQSGERVAIMLRNCPCWMMFDQAAMSLGLVVVPLYTVDRPDNLAYIVNDAGVKVLLLENAEQWRTLRTVNEQLGGVVRFVSINPVSNSDDPRLIAMDDFLPPAARLQTAPPVLSEQLATIVYTSGTTGKPKGVMLSHSNILGNAYASLDIIAVRSDDLLLSFLPLSHTFERTLGYYLPMMTGATVAFARSIPQLSEDLQLIRPTLLVSVPRIYERIHAAILTKLNEGSAFKRKLFHFAVEVGWARFEYRQGRGGWKPSFLLWPMLHKLIAQKLLERMGGRLRTAISGGAALSTDISHMFLGLGLPVVQGYGLTETSPVIAGNRLDRNFPASVGQPIPDIQVRLSARGELQVKGPNVMLGYWNNPEATHAMIAADGWLNTGDVAHISETGHIYITGRTKDIIVMSNGEKIPPSDMELAILHDPLFDQAMIFGEGRPYLVALVVLNPDSWNSFSREVGIHGDMPESLYDSRIESRILKRMARNLRGFPGYAKVNRILLLREPWSIENGMLTPTLKLKRPEVARRYAGQISQLYDGH